MIHLEDVDCVGNESLLSDCGHRGIGNEDCREGIEDAGVICTSKFPILVMYHVFIFVTLLQMGHVWMELSI